MVLALACAGAVAVFAYLDGSRDPTSAVKAATKSEGEPLARSDPGVEPWREEPVALVDDETEDPEPRPTCQNRFPSPAKRRRAPAI